MAANFRTSVYPNGHDPLSLSQNDRLKLEVGEKEVMHLHHHSAYQLTREQNDLGSASLDS